jgi:hypothetical protein
VRNFLQKFKILRIIGNKILVWGEGSMFRNPSRNALNIIELDFIEILNRKSDVISQLTQKIFRIFPPKKLIKFHEIFLIIPSKPRSI